MLALCWRYAKANGSDAGAGGMTDGGPERFCFPGAMIALAGAVPALAGALLTLVAAGENLAEAITKLKFFEGGPA